MSADRPKRQIVQKTLDYNGGILWREEKELRKALYASLQSLKPHRKGDSTTGSLPGSSCSTPPTFRRYKERRLPKKCKEKKEEERDKGYSSDTTFNSQHKTRIRKKRKESISSSSVNSNSETEVEELPKPKKPRVHAQRKFPSSLPGTPNTTPVKCRRGSSSLLTKKCPKTEDFLTFLCLRGTPVLPTTMEIFGAPPSPEKLRDEKEHKHISHDSATANTSTASVTAVDNEDSGVSMDRSSTVSHDGANSPVSSITELITDESTNESLQDANATTNAKVGKVITPVNTHITCHSPPPGIVFKQGSPPNLKPVPPLLCIVSKRAPPPLIPMFSHRNSTATSASLTVPPPIMCTGMSPKILTNHTLSKPKPNCTVVREDVTDKEKESEHAQCTKQGINNINMEDLRVSYVKLTDARHDQGQSNKTKRSKPPKLLYIPSKSKTKNTVTSIDHSKNAEISPKVSKMRREETKVTGESVFKKQLNVEIIKVKEEKGLKERKSTRTFKNHLLTACPIIADSNMDRSVSRGTRNATAKERTRTETHTQKSNSASQEKTYKRESTLVYKSEAGLVYKTNNNSICNNQISVTCKRKTMEIQDMLNPVKRKRGRPPGSKNKSTLRQIAEAASSTVSTSNKRLKHASTTTVFSNNNIITTLPATVSCKANINTIITTTAAATATTTTTNNAISTSVSSTVSISSNNILRNPPALIHVASTSSTSGVSACPLEAKVHDAPVFHPTAEEWQDPLVYIKQISATAQPYGMCKVIPPKGWRPECKLNEDMRFSTQIQYVQMMNKRWGPNVQQLQCIKKHLSDQGVKLSTSPLVAGCEVDLVKFSQTMAQFGGLQNINDKKSWTKIAEAMRMPKSSQISRLDDVYCKYLLSYDMLSKDEKEKLERQVILERQRKPRVVAENDRNSCVAKGKSVVLTQFFRVARNMMNLCFKNDPTVTDVEEEYWKLVSEKSQHIAVQWARVDTSVAGSGFPTGKSHPYAKHNWNLNNLARNQGNLLSHLGSEPDVTIPWLKVGMVYSTEFWKYDPYALPFVEYQHTGADKIWYCVPHSHKEKFETVMKSVVPEMCINNSNRNYLAKSSVMVSPTNLAKEGVPITRVVIENGEYLVTFPGCYTSSICCGYNVSECIYYALPSWVQFATQANKVTKELRLPPMFSFERLICLASTIEVTKGNTEIIECLLHELKLIRDLELQLREQLMLTGVKSMAKMAVTNVVMNQDLRRKKILKIQVDPEDKRCDTCQQLCHLSQVVNDKEEDTYCLQHALNYIKKGGSKACNGLKLMYRYEKEQLNKLVEQLEDCLNDKSKISPGRGRTSNKRKCTESVVELLS